MTENWWLVWRPRCKCLFFPHFVSSEFAIFTQCLVLYVVLYLAFFAMIYELFGHFE